MSVRKVEGVVRLSLTVLLAVLGKPSSSKDGSSPTATLSVRDRTLAGRGSGSGGGVRESAKPTARIFDQGLQMPRGRPVRRYESLELRRTIGSLFTGVRGRGILRTSSLRSSGKFALC